MIRGLAIKDSVLDVGIDTKDGEQKLYVRQVAEEFGLETLLDYESALEFQNAIEAAVMTLKAGTLQEDQ